MFYASYGSFIHKLIEQYYHGKIKKEDLSTSFLLGFSSEVQGERPPASTVRKYIESGKKYFDSFNDFPFIPVSVEEELRFEIDGTPFVAFADFIGKRDGKLAIVDHKSRELKQRSTRAGKETAGDRELNKMLMQLYIYAHGIYQNYGELPKLLCFNCFKNGQWIEEPFNRRVYIQTLDWAKRKTEEIAEEEEFRPNIDYFQCKYLCGLHDRCCYYQGGGVR